MYCSFHGAPQTANLPSIRLKTQTASPHSLVPRAEGAAQVLPGGRAGYHVHKEPSLHGAHGVVRHQAVGRVALQAGTVLLAAHTAGLPVGRKGTEGKRSLQEHTLT